MKTVKTLITISLFYTEIDDVNWVHIRSLNLWGTVNIYCGTCSYFSGSPGTRGESEKVSYFLGVIMLSLIGLYI